MNPTPQDKIIHYYQKKGSRWGYTFLLQGVKHFGYYAEGMEYISMREAKMFMVEKLAEKLNLNGNSLLLDAGCGEGSVAIYLAQHYGFRIHRVDLLDLNVEKASKSVPERFKKQVLFHVMDYSKLDFPDETFDTIYTMETLVHAPNYTQTLQEFHRVLKPHGTLVLFEYSLGPSSDLPSEEEKIWQLIIEETGMHSLPFFLHDQFPAILQQAGFTDVSVDNISLRILPMLRKFAVLSFIPYQFIKLFRLQRKFVNTVTGRVGATYVQHDLWRYNIVTATKAK